MPPPENQDPKEQEGEYYDLNDCDYIAAAYNALAAFEALDVYDADLLEMKERTIFKSIQIIDRCIAALHDSIMEEE